MVDIRLNLLKYLIKIGKPKFLLLHFTTFPVVPLIENRVFLGLSLGKKYSTGCQVAPTFPVDEGSEEVSRGFKRSIIIIKHAYIDRDQSP